MYSARNSRFACCTMNIGARLHGRLHACAMPIRMYSAAIGVFVRLSTAAPHSTANDSAQR